MEQRKRDFLDVLIAERRETDQALQLERDHSDGTLQSRDETLAIIAHDLRNYLGAIGFKADLLGRMRDNDPERQRMLAQQISHSCKIMERWANDLVDITSMDSGALSLEKRAVDAAEIVNASCEAFRPAATDRGVQLASRLPPSPVHVCGDRDRLVQVLNNLLDNALKFIAGPGTITVEVAPAGDSVELSVEDTGPGIPEAEQGKLFDRYWHSKKGGVGGTGLGLFICKRIVEAHGGQISVESEVGRGTTFRFSVPAARPRTLRGSRVLITERVTGSGPTRRTMAQTRHGRGGEPRFSAHFLGGTLSARWPRPS
jgi:signal transduction histidine kinase